MSRAPRFVPSVLVAAGTIVLVACGDARDTTAPDAPRLEAAASGGGGGPSIASANPSYGHRGDIALAVTVSGSGFKPGAQASWKIDGIPTADVTVQSTQYVSSTELIATVNISGTAELTLYDVSVTQSGRKGIGTESVTAPDLFEVTTAIVAQGLSSARRVNDNGELSGTLAAPGGVAYFNTTTGYAQQVSATGIGYGIGALGNVIAGDGAGPTVWTRIGPAGSPWQASALPLGASATSSSARGGLLTDATGQATMVGGYETDATGKRTSIQRPILWAWQSATSSWIRVVLPTPTTGDVSDLSLSGPAVGMANGQAAVWTPDGSGGYALIMIGPDGSRASRINSAGTLIVGRVGTGGGLTAVYWQRSGGSWSAPITLPGDCDFAKGVSDAGRIALNSCLFGSKRYPAYIDPPYAAPVRLSGLGSNNTIGEIVDISPSGQYVAGMATVGGNAQAIYWKLY